LALAEAGRGRDLEEMIEQMYKIETTLKRLLADSLGATVRLFTAESCPISTSDAALS
jgi:hypothetical protein